MSGTRGRGTGPNIPARKAKRRTRKLRFWSDCETFEDVKALVRKMRAPRFDRLGRRRPKP
jgi:hypothetical protein